MLQVNTDRFYYSFLFGTVTFNRNECILKAFILTENIYFQFFFSKEARV